MTDPATFDAWWSRPVEWIDAPNSRGSGWSRTGRARAEDWPELGRSGAMFVKRQERFFCRPVWNFGRRTPTLHRERRALEICHQHGIAVPRVLGYGEHDDRAVLLIEALPEARSFVDAMNEASSAERSHLLRKAVALMARLHELRIRHGAMYPKHIMFTQEKAWLIDLEKARRVLSRASAARRDVEQFLRHATFLTDAERALVRSGLE